MKRLALLVVMLAGCTKTSEEKKSDPPPVAPSAPEPAPAHAPAPTPPPAAPTATLPAAGGSTCPIPVIGLRKDGAWVGDAKQMRFATSCNGAPDVAAIGAALCEWKTANPDCSALEVAAADGIAYQHVVSVMDAALAVGQPDIGLTETPSVVLPASSKNATRLASACGAPVPSCQPPVAPASGTGTATATGAGPVIRFNSIPLPPAKPAASLADAAVITITRDGQVSLDKQAVPPGGLKKRLAARKPAAKGTLILQADKDTGTAVLNDVIKTAKDAGFDNIMFAIQRKP